MKRHVLLGLFSALIVFASHSVHAALTQVFFGDSLVDTGNTFFLTGGLVPSVQPDLGLTYYQGRASNGPIWVDQLATDTSRSVNNAWQTETLTGFDNFANFGALSGTYDIGIADVSNTVDVSSGGLITGLPGLPQQVGKFGLLSSGSANPDALYTLWAGANDLLFPLLPDLQASPNLAANQAYDNLSNAIDTLGGLGAQDFLVLNLPDLSRIPLAFTPGTPSPDYLQQASNVFNVLLDGIQFDFPDLNIWVIDTRTLFNALIDDPVAFGFVDGVGPCLDTVNFCTQPDDYVITYDGIHPTSQSHEIIKDLVVSYIPIPPAVILFGSGLLGLVGIARRRKVI